MENKSFFQKVKSEELGFRDIFSEVGRKHTPEETAKMFVAGTPLTTPQEKDMLAGWTKPFAFLRVFGIGLCALMLLYLVYWVTGNSYILYILMAFLPVLVPVSCLILVWEMHVPRNIAFYEVMQMVVVGGVISLACSAILLPFASSQMENFSPVWAGLVEEPAKLLAIWFFLKKKDRNYMLNGILIGFAVGTGFSFAESIGYVFGNYSLGLASYLIAMGGQVDLNEAIAFGGMVYGIPVALLRASNAIAGHGVYASLYGGMLALSKGKEELRPGHMADGRFLAYFAAAVLLHGLNNLDADLGLPVLTTKYDVPVLSVQHLLITAVALAVWFPVLRRGISQIVGITVEKNGGLTRAVEERAAGNAVGAAAGEEAKAWYLIGLSGAWAGRQIRLEKGIAVRLGRDARRASVALPGCESVSGLHCEIVYDGRTVRLTDLNSSNGTFVGSMRLKAQEGYRLRENAVIYLADRRCSFRLVCEQR